jgi:hypothetical protein
MVILTICPIDHDKRYRRSYRITQHFGEHFPLKDHGWTELDLADESGVGLDEKGTKKCQKVRQKEKSECIVSPQHSDFLEDCWSGRLDLDQRPLHPECEQATCVSTVYQ